MSANVSYVRFLCLTYGGGAAVFNLMRALAFLLRGKVIPMIRGMAGPHSFRPARSSNNKRVSSHNAGLQHRMCIGPAGTRSGVQEELRDTMESRAARPTFLKHVSRLSQISAVDNDSVDLGIIEFSSKNMPKDFQQHMGVT